MLKTRFARLPTLVTLLMLLLAGPVPAQTGIDAVPDEGTWPTASGAGEVVAEDDRLPTENGAEAIAGDEEALPTGNGIEVVAEIDQGPGNITVTPDGRILVSLHQFFGTEMRVAEVLPDGALVPFPDAWWAVGFQSRLALNSVLGIQSDPRGVVWMLDNGMRDGVIPKLVGWDTQSNRLERLITLPRPVTAENSFVNDLAVDRDHDAIYIADPAGGDNAALIVVDLRTGTSRRVLEGHQSVVPEDMDLVIDDRALEIRQPDGSTVRPRVGVNPIVLDHDNEWLYFGPMHGTSLYRIRTAHLRDPILDREGRLASVVERHGDKVISDGSSMDSHGNVYISDLAGSAVGVTDPDGGYRQLVSDARLAWPDAFSFGPDGLLYGVANQLHRSATLNAGTDETQPPFLIFRINPLADGVLGR